MYMNRNESAIKKGKINFIIFWSLALLFFLNNKRIKLVK